MPSLSSSGTLPIVALRAGEVAAQVASRQSCRSSRAASNSDRRVRPCRAASPRLLKANCWPVICPLAAARWNGELPRRPFEHRTVDARVGEHRPARRLTIDRRTDRADRQARRAELQRAHLQIVEADDRAGGAEGEAAAVAEPAVDRQPQRLHPAVREGAVELGDGAERGRAARARTEADRRQRQPLAAGAIGRDVGNAAHRRAGRAAGEGSPGRWAARRRPSRSLLSIRRPPDGPIIGHAAAAEDARLRAVRPDDVGVRRSAPRRRRGSSPP